MKRSIASITIAIVLSAGGAQADDKSECAAAYVSAQTQRDAHALLSTRKELRTCTQSRCDDVLQGQIVKDCSQWLIEVESSIPTIVLSAGSNVEDVVVFIDGDDSRPRKVDGLAVEIDPGPHLLVYDLGSARQERSFVALEGVKNQLVELMFPTNVQPETHSPANEPAGAISGLGSAPPARILIPLGAGVVAFGVGTVFGLLALSDKAKLERDCPNNICPSMASQSNIDALHTTSWVSNIAFAASALGLAVGVVQWVTETRARPVATTSRNGPAQVGLKVAPWADMTSVGVTAVFR